MRNDLNLSRRTFLKELGTASLGLAALPRVWAGTFSTAPALLAGEGHAALVLPEGVELAGFHRPPGQERRVKGIRHTPFVRALVLEVAGVRAALVSLDVAAIGYAASQKIRNAIGQRTGIAPENIKLCAIHTHSMPSLQLLRQWGAVSEEFEATVEEKAAEAVAKAVSDLAPAQLKIGRTIVIGGNFNRTVPVWRTEAEFDEQASDQYRWLDRHLHALVFERSGSRNLLWYHFSAHPVCFADELAGPDWPALVAQLAEERWGIYPGYLQGHIGDVNPGDGQPWRGDAEKVAAAVFAGLEAAVNAAQPVPVDRLVIKQGMCSLPLDGHRWRAWLAEYQQSPAACTGGVWVDEPFAREWFQANMGRREVPEKLDTPIARWDLGTLHFVFHGSELYSYYGLWLRNHSSAEHTLVVGYADDLVGYLTDPRAHIRVEYAAAVVPKILDLPPFQPNAAQVLVQSLQALI